MDAELRSLLQQQFEDFVNARADIVELALNRDEEYQKNVDERARLLKALFNESEQISNCAFELEYVSGVIMYRQTAAAYKQGFNDAKELMEVSQWRRSARKSTKYSALLAHL